MRKKNSSEGSDNSSSMFAYFLLSRRLIHSQCRLHRRLVQTLSSKTIKAESSVRLENNVYSSTLLLPKTPFKLKPDAKDIETRYRKLTCEDLYRWQVRLIGYATIFYDVMSSGKMLKDHFSYYTTDLLTLTASFIWVCFEHTSMGNQFTYSIGHRSCSEQGYKRYHQPFSRITRTKSPVCFISSISCPCVDDIVSYMPGWDCHGLPIEGKAINDMKVPFCFNDKCIFLYS